jgi:hypothetical protein
MTENFGPANDATTESGRKTWRTPQVIEGTLGEAEIGAAFVADTTNLS